VTVFRTSATDAQTQIGSGGRLLRKSHEMVLDLSEHPWSPAVSICDQLRLQDMSTAPRPHRRGLFARRTLQHQSSSQPADLGQLLGVAEPFAQQLIDGRLQGRRSALLSSSRRSPPCGG